MDIYITVTRLARRKEHWTSKPLVLRTGRKVRGHTGPELRIGRSQNVRSLGLAIAGDKSVFHATVHAVLYMMLQPALYICETFPKIGLREKNIELEGVF
jgi:hypothetical protein